VQVEDRPPGRASSDPGHTRRKFAYRIIRRLKELNLNQNDLAAASGISKDAISTYCRGRSLPNDDRLQQLATVLQIEAHFLLPERFPDALPAPARETPLPAKHVRVDMEHVISIHAAAEIMHLLDEEPDEKPPAEKFQLLITPDLPPNHVSFIIHRVIRVHVAVEIMRVLDEEWKKNGPPVIVGEPD
jgi:transcriptional regulator with XRE-family HTH domain